LSVTNFFSVYIFFPGHLFTKIFQHMLSLRPMKTTEKFALLCIYFDVCVFR
jgi:hypothetical protein